MCAGARGCGASYITRQPCFVTAKSMKVRSTDKGALVKVYKAPYVYRGKTKETRRVRILVYIPQKLAERVGISLDPEKSDYVAIVAVDGRLIMRPVRPEELAKLEKPVRPEELVAAEAAPRSPSCD